MNRIIIIIIKGDDYNHTFKWNSVEQFRESVITNTGLPKPTDIVVEAYIDDNLVDIDSIFSVTLNKLKLVTGI